MQQLLLFDIDGTLLDTGGVGLRALRTAFLETFTEAAQNGPDFPNLDLAGSTDSGIARHLFSLFEIELNAENERAFFDSYHVRLEEELNGRTASQGRLMPGIFELLGHLRENTDHVLGLLTGNIARGAWTKISSFKLDGFFEFGAFGDDHHDRNELGPVALDRAENHAGRRFEPAETFIIGDTPKDIRCARACGAWAVAVATGHSPSEQLIEHKPDHFFDDFSDIGAVEAMLAAPKD